MRDLYKSKYYQDLSYFLKNGWNIDEINTFFPLLENLTNVELYELHKKLGISMFSSYEVLDKEQAIHVLVNPTDTKKEDLLGMIEFFSLYK